MNEIQAFDRYIFLALLFLAELNPLFKEFEILIHRFLVRQQQHEEHDHKSIQRFIRKVSHSSSIARFCI